MKISLTVNGKVVNADVTPRTSLADFLREDQLLTGTHLGCEHGICGACTVEIDGEIARSCITYAVTCDGANVRTIEGFDTDAPMALLREAFQREHALQCGYCTPGMLIAARDLIRRKQRLSRVEIRTEMSGNLCRCTGYMGIVSAIESVMHAPSRAHPNADTQPAPTAKRAWLGPAPGPQATTARNAQNTVATTHSTLPRMHRAPVAATRAPAKTHVQVTQGPITETGDGVRLTQSFVLPYPRDAVWQLMSDIPAVARCMPGVVLDGPPGAAGRVTGRIDVKLGPIAAAFAGEAQVTPFPDEFRQRIEGRGGDRKSGSRVTGSVDYRLTPATGAQPGTAAGEATRVEVAIGYALTGMLAQLGRSSLAQDLARRLGETFAQNIAVLLADPSGAGLSQAPLSGVTLLLQAIAGRLRSLLGRIFGARPSA
jgi:aerobic carbon-monoxide dehydrogenase small subunit